MPFESVAGWKTARIQRPVLILGSLDGIERSKLMRERMNEILAHHTGQTVKRIEEDTDRDYILSADQSKEYGIIDDVIRKRA